MSEPSRLQLVVLKRASSRPDGNICPIRIRLYGAAEERFLQGLVRRGWIDYNGGVPIITQAGRLVIPKEDAPS